MDVQESSAQLTLDKLDKRIDEVEQKIKNFTKQIVILMSEMTSPFAVPKDE